MNISLFTYTKNGCDTAKKVMSCFDRAEIKAYAPERFSGEGFLSLDAAYDPGSVFSWSDLIIFVASCGIAVRKIAPFVKDKCKDPAVVCIDECGKFVIPLLSGHIGGANEFAKTVSEALNSVCVITTATDIEGRFSVDSWAKKQGFLIDDMSIAKAVSAHVLENDVPLVSEFKIVSALPNGVVRGESGEIGIYVGIRKKTPFYKTLRIITPVLHLGIGCRKGTQKETIKELVEAVLSENNIDKRAVKCVASIDIKAGEAGLLEYCKENDWDMAFYSADTLNSVCGEFTVSPFVKEITGVDNVCERAASIGAEKLIVKKRSGNGVTVAIAEE
ncbi:MAG: cobalamin biosynthesis protein, partial [Clostridia bacterium]|nr:cobalamin biosynthesis protein [Clostridia bacterium]